MREILFRGKRIDNGEWVLGQVVIRPDHDDGCEKYFICEAGHRFIRCLNKMPCTYEVGPETVGQYTGMKDKNDKRIFEGDIIRAKIEGGNHEGFTWQNMPVDFQQGAFCLNDQNGRVFCVLGAFAPSVSLEVIGNIHDNPELIAEVQDG